MFTIILDRTMKVLLAVGCLALCALMLITAADVVLRYFFNSPITASYELSEIFMGILGPMAILCCAYKGGHVCVDVLYEYFPPALKRFSQLFANLCVLAAVALLCWQSWHLIAELRMFTLASATLGIPMWPLGVVFFLAFALYVLVALQEAAKGGRI